MKTALALITATVLLLVSTGSANAAPPNDDFPGTLITGLPFTDSVDTTQATMQPGEPSCIPNYGNTVWYTYTAPEDMILVFDTTGTEPPGAAWEFEVWQGDSLETLTCVWGVYFGPGHRSTFRARTGRTYRIQVGGEGFAAPLTGQVVFTITKGTPPANDDFPGTTIGSLPFNDTADTTYATIEGGEFSTRGGATVWYNYTPSKGGWLIADTSTSNYNTYLDAWLGPPDPGNQMYVWGDFTMFLEVALGQTYYIRVGGKGYPGEGGKLTFRLNEAAGPPATAPPTPLRTNRAVAELPRGGGMPPDGDRGISLSIVVGAVSAGVALGWLAWLRRKAR